MRDLPPYVSNPYRSARRATREVRVGDVGIGGGNPIRVQSMTNTDTMDTAATVDQIERLAAAGCEIARVTAPSIRDAENLRVIVSELRARAVRVPLVADIHFTPNAALIAAECVEKVRINPGNYADKKKFEVREYSDAEYAAELERVAERFRPLVRRCRANGVAMRIGTNHGSLSDRIMNRFGDSPLGMVESALEFLDVCEDEGYHDVVFSMKASNTHVAIQAYRLLSARLAERAGGAASYPFHLGVTEAGDGEDGRIKSAIGIGALLDDGIGDTIRVSLTEDPVREVPVARAIAARAEADWQREARRNEPVPRLAADFVPDPYRHQRRATARVSLAGLGVGGEEPVRVELDLGSPGGLAGGDPQPGVEALRDSFSRLADIECESLLVSAADEEALVGVSRMRKALDAAGLGLPLAVRVPLDLLDSGAVPPADAARLVVAVDASSGFAALQAVARSAAQSGTPVEWCLSAGRAGLPDLVGRCLEACSGVLASDALLFSLAPGCDAPPVQGVRILAKSLADLGGSDVPIVLRYACGPAQGLDGETDLLAASVDLGALLCDGLGDAISLSGFADVSRAVDLGYRILQGARLRTTRTEYISCPSCGRTLFDLEDTTAQIKARTAHLKGVKIAIMGCIVNGPGEMADADFGYVGSGPGKITLYVGKEIVARNLPEAGAADRLVELIREHGQWQETTGKA